MGIRLLPQCWSYKTIKQLLLPAVVTLLYPLVPAAHVSSVRGVAPAVLCVRCPAANAYLAACLQLDACRERESKLPPGLTQPPSKPGEWHARWLL